MLLRRSCLLLMVLVLTTPLSAADKKGSGISVDKKAGTVTIDCIVAPRKLPNLEQVYPIEVIATFPAPKGQKAHETVVTFTVKPSDVHKALEGLGIKPGKPARGKGQTAKGTELSIDLLIPEEGGTTKRVPIEETMINKTTGKPLPKMHWLFTGSVMTNPDPEQDEKVYGADVTGTLITLFPVTDEAVVQSSLSFEQQDALKVETNPKVLPKIGTPLKLVIQMK